MKKVTDIAQLDLNKQYTYADYLTWHFNDRVELIKGWLHKMTPAPRRVHQETEGNIYYMLRQFLDKKY